MLEEERRTKTDPQTTLALAAVGGKDTCKYCKRPGHEDSNRWDKHSKPDGAESKDQERKRKKRDDDDRSAIIRVPIITSWSCFSLVGCELGRLGLCLRPGWSVLVRPN